MEIKSRTQKGVNTWQTLLKSKDEEILIKQILVYNYEEENPILICELLGKNQLQVLLEEVIK